MVVMIVVEYVIFNILGFILLILYRINWWRFWEVICDFKGFFGLVLLVIFNDILDFFVLIVNNLVLRCWDDVNLVLYYWKLNLKVLYLRNGVSKMVE